MDDLTARKKKLFSESKLLYKKRVLDIFHICDIIVYIRICFGGNSQ